MAKLVADMAPVIVLGLVAVKIHRDVWIYCAFAIALTGAFVFFFWAVGSPHGQNLQ